MVASASQLRTPVSVPALAGLLGLSRPLAHYWLQRLEIPLQRMADRAFVWEDEVPAILQRIKDARAREGEAVAEDGYLTIPEARALSGLTPATLYTLSRTERVSSLRRGGRRLIQRASLEAYLAGRRRGRR